MELQQLMDSQQLIALLDCNGVGWSLDPHRNLLTIDVAPIQLTAEQATAVRQYEDSLPSEPGEPEEEWEDYSLPVLPLPSRVLQTI